MCLEDSTAHWYIQCFLDGVSAPGTPCPGKLLPQCLVLWCWWPVTLSSPSPSRHRREPAVQTRQALSSPAKGGPS